LDNRAIIANDQAINPFLSWYIKHINKWQCIERFQLNEKERPNMKNNILIAYYSWSGNTRKIAELIERETGGTLFEIEPVQPYTTNYGAAVAQAKEEIRAGFRPELKAIPEITSYAVVFLGTPIWWHTMAPPLAAFIDRYDLNRKTVVPFHTHGGGGVGSFEEDIAKMCPNSTVTKGFGAYNSGGNETITAIGVWLNAIGLPSRK
jgi:flavodoxin